MVANNTISSYRSVGRKYAVKNLLSLLKLAPEINIARSGDAKTLMHLAAERSDRELAKTLLLAGFTLGKTKDARGMTPWRIAYRNADGDFMTFLQQHGLQTEIMPGDRVQHDFCKAIQRKEYFKLKSLLTQGADYREKQVDSLDMLQAACAKEDLALVKALLDAGVRPDRNADRKRSFYFVRNPLQIAVLKNNLKLFSLLLNYRMDPSIMVPYYLGGWVSLPFYIVHVHFDNKKIKSGRIIAFLEEMRRHSWEVNSVVPGEHYNNKPLLSSLLRYCEGNYRASKRLLDLVSYLLRIGAEVDPSEPAVQRLLRQNETSFKRRNRISNSSQQDRQKIGVLLRRAVLQNPVRNRP